MVRRCRGIGIEPKISRMLSVLLLFPLDTLSELLSSINELEHFIVKHRKDYVGLQRTTEQERDDIEHEVSIFIKSCKDQIDVLKN
ncbi:putative SNARE-complex protein Syntaxin-18 [Dioscorea sansibarensis]